MERYFALCILVLFFTLVEGIVNAQFPGVSQACTVVNWVRTLLLVFVVMAVIFAGYKLMTGSGDPKSIQDAKTTIIIALVGGAIIYAAFTIAGYFVGTPC